MTTNESLISISKFIAGYSAHLMGAGVHTSRVSEKPMGWM